MSELVPDDPVDDRLAQIRRRTPARILTGRIGGSYEAATWLQLRGDHAAARDAVRDEVDLSSQFDPEFALRWDLFEVSSRARSKNEYLLRPDLGRSLGDGADSEIRRRRNPSADLQIVLGDGLSAAALISQAPPLVDRIAHHATAAGLCIGPPFFVRYCRVGMLNDVGEILDPAVVVLLIGERPGLATAESLSAYMAYRPRPGHDDSRRNLISNIQPRGVPTDQAASRIIALALKMSATGTSGVEVKEDGFKGFLGATPIGLGGS